MNGKETLKCNRVVSVDELSRNPVFIQYIMNQIDSDIGEEVMHRIRDNGEFIVRAKTKEEQYEDIVSTSIVGTAEITRLIRCKDCKYWDLDWQTIEDRHYCPMVDKQTLGDFFCGDGGDKNDP